MPRKLPGRDRDRRVRAPAATRAPPEDGAVLLRVVGTDEDGDTIARPIDWEGGGPPPRVHLRAEAAGAPALAPGARVLATLRPIGRGGFEGRTLRRLDEAPPRVLGVFHLDRRGGGRIEPTDRRDKAEWSVPPGETGGAEPGEIVVAEPLPVHRLGTRPARVTERLGPLGDPRVISLLVIHANDIPTVFPDAALAEADAARRPTPRGRTDLRSVPLVTIDGEDARDFDDAVFAEPDPGGGFRLMVAIADVAHYVRPGSALDAEARRRGNSLYFPDRVVPMLPEPLSNGWCSLRPQEDRACLFVEMQVDAQGRKRAHRFGRGLMRSAARLTYEAVQQAHDAGTAPAPGIATDALFAAYRALLAARRARGTLDLDLPERRVVLTPDGRVASVEPRARLDSHRLIEEFMVLANVCAAEELERLAQPCVYRVHAPPSDEKVEALRLFLHDFAISLPQGRALHPRDLDRVLARVAGTEQASLVNEVVLRSQSQAAYSPDNIGHFGLALARYAHFTSPIRRYADLLVHRALIAGLRLGPGGLPAGAAPSFDDTAAHITGTERRGALAERDATDRYLAAFMADQVGRTFRARVSGVARFGLFITIVTSGASGLVPVSSLPDEYWFHDEAAHTLVGRASGRTFRLAQELDVRLTEANPATGGLIFAVAGGGDRPRAPARSSGSPRGRAAHR